MCDGIEFAFTTVNVIEEKMSKFIIAIVLLYSLPLAASSARIIKVDKTANRILVNNGSADDISIEDEVCVLFNGGVDFSCGTVIKASLNKSLIEIKSRNLKTGMRVYFLSSKGAQPKNGFSFKQKAKSPPEKRVSGNFFMPEASSRKSR